MSTLTYNHAQAIRFIEDAFPELACELSDEGIAGLLHIEMGEFCRLAQSFIDRQDKGAWCKVCATFAELWLNSDVAVKNALGVAFLEHLNFKDGKVARSWAVQAMPSMMRNVWRELMAGSGTR